MARIDADSNYVLMAAEDNAGAAAVPVAIDAATGLLLVEIYAASASSDLPTEIQVDANGHSVGFAVTDDANETPVPLLVDSSGRLLVDYE